jgi:hypothetical protein
MAGTAPLLLAMRVATSRGPPNLRRHRWLSSCRSGARSLSCRNLSCRGLLVGKTGRPGERSLSPACRDQLVGRMGPRNWRDQPAGRTHRPAERSWQGLLVGKTDLPAANACTKTDQLVDNAARTSGQLADKTDPPAARSLPPAWRGLLVGKTGPPVGNARTKSDPGSRTQFSAPLRITATHQAHRSGTQPQMWTTASTSFSRRCHEPLNSLPQTFKSLMSNRHPTARSPRGLPGPASPPQNRPPRSRSAPLLAATRSRARAISNATSFAAAMIRRR